MYMYIPHTCICVDDKDNCLFSYTQLSSFIFMPVYFHLHHRLFTSPRLHFPKNKSLPVGGGWRGFSGEGASGRSGRASLQWVDVCVSTQISRCERCGLRGFLTVYPCHPRHPRRKNSTPAPAFSKNKSLPSGKVGGASPGNVSVALHFHY